MKTYKKGIALSLAILIAASTSVPAFAAENTSAKEEVIYIMTQADGTVDNINVVNLFCGGNITDYGDYSSVKMLTTTDEINQTGDTITFSSSAEKVYYQGTLKEKEIPWNISIQYFLDNKEYTAEEIAGKSGSLEIKISITENSDCKGSYFNDYALQSTFVLDTDICSNIQADGATVANVGSDKQLLYTVLPGKGLEASIYADVKNFEMDSVSINGIKLNLNVEIDDEELTEKVEELMEATQKLNDGATEIYDGTEDLKTGSSSLDTGISSLNSGVSDLDSGIATLQNGMKSMQTGLNTLNGQSSTLTKSSTQIKTALETIQNNLSAVSISADQLQQLTSASSKIKSGISNLSEGISSLKNNLGYAQYKAVMSQNGLDIDSLKNNNQQAITNCSNQIESLNQTIATLENQTGYESQVTQLREQVSNLENIIQLLSANNVAIGGTESYLNSVSQGVDDLYNGVATLQNEYDKFDTAISELADSLSGMVTKMSELTTGINQLVTNYKEFDNGLNTYTDGVATIVSGYNQMVSGISSLASGSKELLNGSDKLSSGSSELYDGIAALCDGAKELNDGTSELNSETSKMDTEILDKIDEILSSIEGEKTETKSFVSEKNKNVDNVQFVIKTSAIEKEEPEVEKKEQSETKSLWQKFIQLFGF
ncbi:hypothetical protein [Eubacterium oxidoreducens]|uniref:Putative membrane protein n=1 Tax=Eubacterium oxidoreducens TaxID=1732 RepID=A0A1G6BXC4_EUBOX|nr:hypothetical protein [Eubacterium oxidoreducens]SDB25276.1 putative membrane protein [Eubacterium oxidoreducens]